VWARRHAIVVGNTQRIARRACAFYGRSICVDVPPTWHALQAGFETDALIGTVDGHSLATTVTGNAIALLV
jgi:hypothetical protein